MRRVVLTEPESLTIFDSKMATVAGSVAHDSPVTPRPVPMLRSQHRDLVTIVSRCLEKDPARRMISAAFFSDELERFQRGEPVQSRPVGSIERWWKWVRRNKVAVAAAVVTGTALVAGTTISITQAVRATKALALAKSSTAIAEASAAEARLQLTDANSATKVMLETVSSIASSKSGRPLERSEILSELVKRARAFTGSPLSKSRLLSSVCEVAPAPQRLEIRQEALALAEPLLQPDDPQLWNLRYEVARQKSSQRATREEGIEELRTVEKWSRGHLGPEHGNTVRATITLGRSLNSAGQYDEAIELLGEIDALTRRKPGLQGAGSRIGFRVDYASALFNAGRKEEALACGRETIKFATSEFGPDSFDTARALMPHARLCQKSKLDNEAAMAARQALDIYWKTVGPLDWGAKSALNMLLELRRQRDDTEGVLALHREALREFDTQVGPSHQGTVVRVAALSRALMEAQRAKDADELNTGWLKRIRLADGTLPADAEDILRAQVDVLKKLAQWPRVELALQELIDMIEKARPQDLQRHGFKSDLADVMIKLGRPAEAEKLLHSVITALEEAANRNDKVVVTHLPLAKKRLGKAVEEKAKMPKVSNPS
jgi:tetratricopeptide (TPR) repeat protein